MRAAILKLAKGDRAAVPYRLRLHLVAARYGQTPDQVRDWPADDFADACSFMEVTG